MKPTKPMFILNGQSVLITFDGNLKLYNPGDALYESVLEYCNKDNATQEGLESLIINGPVIRPSLKKKSLNTKPKLNVLVDSEKPVDEVVKCTRGGSKITFENDFVFFGETELSNHLGKKIQKLYANGERDFIAYERFLTKLFSNPTKIGFNSVIDYVGKNGLRILSDGDIIAYKGVGADHYSLHGNTKTVVKTGKVNSKGQIHNVIGSTIEVERSEVDMSRSSPCSHGLHVGSHSYAGSFGPVLMTVRVNPADICCVPHDSNCEKVRCCKYTPVAFSKKSYGVEEGEHVIVNTSKTIVDDQFAPEDDEDFLTDAPVVMKAKKTKVRIINNSGEQIIIPKKEAKTITVVRKVNGHDGTIEGRVLDYVKKKLVKHGDCVTVRKIMCAFPRDKGLTPMKILAILNGRGFKMTFDRNHTTNTVVARR